MEQKERPIIEIENLRKVYTQGKMPTEALKGINLSVYRGEYVGIVGKSGAGKTTLLNMIAGLDKITSGTARVGDALINELSEDRKANWRGKKVGFIFQSFQLMPGLNLRENVMLPMDFCGLYREPESKEKAEALLEMVGLEDHADKKPSEISGGQQQRVAIARALINDPEILLADEPTGRLDSVTTEKIFAIFEKALDNGATMIIVSHDRGLAERTKRLIRLEDGMVVDDSAARQVLSAA